VNRFARCLPLLVIAFSGGCNEREEPQTADVQRNYIGYVADNRFFRVDLADGSVDEYIKGKLVPVSEEPTKLTAGRTFVNECGEVVRYDGHLQFTPLPTTLPVRSTE
jgi:hypothetical protein